MPHFRASGTHRPRPMLEESSWKALPWLVVVAGASDVVVGASVVVVDGAPPAIVVAELTLVTGTQVPAFQCRITMSGVPELPGTLALLLPALSHPTAQALERDVAAKPKRPPSSPLSAGMGARVQALPLHWKITPFVGPSPLPLSPAAHDLLDESEVTAKRLTPPPTVGWLLPPRMPVPPRDQSCAGSTSTVTAVANRQGGSACQDHHAAQETRDPDRLQGSDLGSAATPSRSSAGSWRWRCW